MVHEHIQSTKVKTIFIQQYYETYSANAVLEHIQFDQQHYETYPVKIL